MEHTPGPWKWEVFGGSKMPVLKCAIGDHGSEVCNFGDAEQYYPTEGTPPNEADSRLIAAAPELLAAVKAEYALCAPLSTRGRALGALIAKCEGK